MSSFLEYFRCKTFTSVVFAEGSKLKKIGNSAFFETKITSLTIPAKVEEIGSYAFYNCYNLEEVLFAEGSLLEKIGNGAFYGTKITSITIPALAEEIGNNAFFN